jgi:hypothetical protein
MAAWNNEVLQSGSKNPGDCFRKRNANRLSVFGVENCSLVTAHLFSQVFPAPRAFDRFSVRAENDFASFSAEMCDFLAIEEDRALSRS